MHWKIKVYHLIILKVVKNRYYEKSCIASNNDKTPQKSKMPLTEFTELFRVRLLHGNKCLRVLNILEVRLYIDWTIILKTKIIKL